MKLNFDSIFKAEPLSEMKVQDVIIEKMNRDLSSEEIEYISTDNGYCALTTKRDKLVISGFKFCLKDEDKQILGETPSVEDIIEYSYNSQRAMKLATKEEGYIFVNGEKLELHKLIHKPLANLKIIEESLYAIPHPFTSSFDVILACGEFERMFKVKRVANNNISTLSFEGEKEEPLVLKYTMIKESQIINLGLSYNFKYAKSIRELIECATIYNGFFEGKVKLFETPLNGTDKEFINKIDQDIILFWKKAYKIERYMNFSFGTSILDADDEERSIVEKLYYGLIKHKPIRENKHLTNATFDENYEESEVLIGKEIYFEFQGIEAIELFGRSFDVHCSIGLYGVVIEDIQILDNKYKAIFSNEKKDGNSFMVLKYFKSNRNLVQYRKKITSERIARLHSAKTVFEYYEEDRLKVK